MHDMPVDALDDLLVARREDAGFSYDSIFTIGEVELIIHRSGRVVRMFITDDGIGWFNFLNLQVLLSSQPPSLMIKIRI